MKPKKARAVELHVIYHCPDKKKEGPAVYDAAKRSKLTKIRRTKDGAEIEFPCTFCQERHTYLLPFNTTTRAAQKRG